MEKLEREETIKSLCDADTHGLDGKVRDGFVRKCISIGVMELLATIFEIRRKMKRISNRKYRLKYFVKCWNKDGNLIVDGFKQIKQKVVDLLCSVQWQKAYIKVVYNKDQWNDSDHYSLESAIDALNKYTEKQMLDFVEGGKNGNL